MFKEVSSYGELFLYLHIHLLLYFWWQNLNPLEKEVITNEARVQKMRDESRDIYDIRKQEEVLQESYMMIPDSNRRLGEAIVKLQEALAEEEEEDSKNEAKIQEARDMVIKYNEKQLDKKEEKEEGKAI